MKTGEKHIKIRGSWVPIVPEGVFENLVEEFRGISSTSRNFEEFRGISRNFEEFQGISRMFEDFRGISRTIENFRELLTLFRELSRNSRQWPKNTPISCEKPTGKKRKNRKIEE